MAQATLKPASSISYYGWEGVRGDSFKEAGEESSVIETKNSTKKTN